MENEGGSLEEANKIIKIDWQKLAGLESGLAPFQHRIKTLAVDRLWIRGITTFFGNDQ